MNTDTAPALVKHDLKMLTPKQTHDLQAYLKNVLGIEPPRNAALVILSESNQTVAFPSHNRWLLNDTIRLQAGIKDAIEHGDLELAEMAQRTLDSVLTPTDDDVDIPL